MVSQRRDGRFPPASGPAHPIEEETVMQPAAHREELWQQQGGDLPATAPNVFVADQGHAADGPDRTVLLPANFAPRPIAPAAPSTAPFPPAAPSSDRLPLPPPPAAPRPAESTGRAPLPAWVWVYVFAAALLALAGLIILFAESRVLGHF